jgi:hypothetical protein
MSDKRWRPRASIGNLGPGVPRLNDASFLMTRYAFRAVDPAAGKAFAEDLRDLHRAFSESSERGRAVATRMRQRIDALLAALETWKVDASTVRGVVAALLADGRSGEFLDYAGAEQASLAAQVLFQNLFSLGAISEARLDQVAAETATLLASVKDPERYDRRKAVASFERLTALMR